MRKEILKFACQLGLPYLLRNKRGDSTTVLSLHRISEEPDFFFQPIKPATFEKLLEYCVKHYEVITFADRVKKTEKPGLILSFDDGYYDFIEHALPILNKFGIRCNHNLVNICVNTGENIWTQKMNDTFNFLKDHNIKNDEIISGLGVSFSNSGANWTNYYLAFFRKLLVLKMSERTRIIGSLTATYGISKNQRMMNWKDVRNCIQKHQVEFGSHTYNHDVLSTLHTEGEFENEIGRSIAEIEKETRLPVTVLALPNGQYNTGTINYCEKKGIRYVMLTDDKRNGKLENNFNMVSRVYLVNESIEESILRTELLHSKLRGVR